MDNMYIINYKRGFRSTINYHRPYKKIYFSYTTYRVLRFLRLPYHLDKTYQDAHFKNYIKKPRMRNSLTQRPKHNMILKKRLYIRK